MIQSTHCLTQRQSTKHNKPFLGSALYTPQNIPTTLKRDGSDFSAAIMGALFKARQVTIWTDVDGVYSADPRKGLLCFVLCL